MVKLILYPNHSKEPNKVCWLISSQNDAESTPAQETDWTKLPKLKPKDEVVLVVPATDITFKQAQLPQTNRQKLLQALPYMFEEELADNVQNLHFAYVQSKKEHYGCIAITKKTNMQHWIGFLKAYNLVPSAIFPENLLLPLHENGLTIFMHNSIALIRTGKDYGTSIDLDLLPTFLSQQFKNDQNAKEQDEDIEIAPSLELEKARHASVHIYSAPNQQLKEMMDSIGKRLNVSVHWYQPNISLLETFSETLKTAPPALNLLQAEFQRVSGVNRRHWYVSAGLAITIFAVIFIANIVENFTLRSQLNAVEQSVFESYKSIFPEATSVTAPQTRIQERIDSLRQAQTNNPLLQLLSVVGQAIGQTPGVYLMALSYNNPVLTLTLESTSASILDNLNRQLQQQGIEIRGNTINADGNVTIANLIITLPNGI